MDLFHTTEEIELCSSVNADLGKKTSTIWKWYKRQKKTIILFVLNLLVSSSLCKTESDRLKLYLFGQVGQ